MLQTFNLTNTDYDLGRFSGAEALDDYCREYGLDGVELMPYEGFSAGYISPRRLIGLHLNYQPCWVDFWRGDEAAVVAEFGSLEEAYRRFGGEGKAAIIDQLRAQLVFARESGVKYVVFHVSDVSLREILTYRFIHTDEEVAQASLELIRAAMGAEDWGFDFLVENLWWPGLTLLRPEVTRALIEGIPGARKGVMLDTGHLMHTNWDIRDQRGAVEYIHRTLDRDPFMEAHVRGVHLQCGITGDFVREKLKNPPVLTGGYQQRLGDTYEVILGTDPHGPFDDPSVGTLIDRLKPAYLTHEFITWDLPQATEYLIRQKRAMGVCVAAK